VGAGEFGERGGDTLNAKIFNSSVRSRSKANSAAGSGAKSGFHGRILH
jgi:hypothetical protein